MQDMFGKELKLGDAVVWCEVKYNTSGKTYITGTIVSLDKKFVGVKLTKSNFYLSQKAKDGVLNKHPECVIKLN